MNKNIVKIIYTILYSICAGLAIGIAALCKYNIESALIGALVFPIGILIVINKKYLLFTGKIGYIVQEKNYADLLIMLILNMLAARCIGIINGVSASVSFSKADIPIYLFQSIICGFLVYIAVSAKDSLITYGSIAAFILIGGKHCIAEAFRLSFNINNILYLLAVAIGNSIGAIAANHIEKVKLNYQGTR